MTRFKNIILVKTFIFYSLSCLIPCLSLAAPSVALYGSGTYTDYEVTVDLYANVTECDLLSYGVRLSHDPADLTVVSANNNEGLWFFGNIGIKHPYAAPDTINTGDVTFIGGTLEIGNLVSGITGSDVLLGTVSFVRTSSSLPSFSLALGKSGDYKNFVTTDGAILDDEIGGIVFQSVTLNQIESTDTDNDGLSDFIESKLGTNPNNPDSDNDGLADGDEDKNHDGIIDLAAGETNPLSQDSDNDGCLDGIEVLNGRNPSVVDDFGDLNGNCQVDLNDFILAQQILSQTSSGDSLDLNADVDGDAQLGIAEAIYILQKLSELR